MDQESTEKLIEAARAVMAHAYAPYSRFRVGAAVLAGGTIFSGCNVENASYGLTTCAERVAVFAAVVAGERRIEAVAVVTEAADTIAPCGACRQVLYEFGPGMTVVMSAGGGTAVRTLSDLLPLAFGPEHLSG